MGISRDITERKKTEEALRSSEEKFRNLFENANDCMIFLDSSGRILETNRKAIEVFGGSKKELVGKHFIKVGVLSSRDIPKVLSTFAKVLAGKEATLDLCIKNKRGQEVRLECLGSLMRINGRFTGCLVVARDITERKKAERALRKSEEKYKCLVELAPDGILTIDMKGVITSVNNAFSKLTGYSRDEIVGKHFTKLRTIRKRDIPKCIKLFSSFFRRKISRPIEFVYLRKDGTARWCEAHASLVKTGDKTVGGQVILRDITERKQWEETIRKSEEKHRGLVELAPDGIITLNLKGVITSVNKVFLRRTGFSRDEIVGKHFTKLGTIRARDIPKYIRMFSSFVREKRITPIQYVYFRKDGTPRWGEVHASLIRENGKAVGIQAITREITERKKMEEKLKQYSEHLEELVQKRTEELLESEKKYSVLVEEASDGVFIGQDGKIVFVNEKGAEIVGYSRDELIRLPLEKLMDEKHLQIVKERHERRLRGEKVPPTYEVELIAKTGERVPVEVSATRINYQGRPAALAIMRDARERKRMEEERLKLEKLATIGELATMVAHDLRNPLTSIRNAVYYNRNSCPQHAKPECKTAMEMLYIIEKEAVFANKIVSDLLDFSAKIPLEKKRQNINRIIEESLTESSIPEKIKIRRKFDEKTIATVDGKQLQRVFINLAKNAVQAMPEGGKLTIRTSGTRDHIEIAFTDTGVGIPEENMGKLFQPLFTTKAKGIGMGLAICKKIVEHHEGTIEAKSKVGKGTTFTIELPKKGGK